MGDTFSACIPNGCGSRDKYSGNWDNSQYCFWREEGLLDNFPDDEVLNYDLGDEGLGVKVVRVEIPPVISPRSQSWPPPVLSPRSQTPWSSAWPASPPVWPASPRSRQLAEMQRLVHEADARREALEDDCRKMAKAARLMEDRMEDIEDQSRSALHLGKKLQRLRENDAAAGAEYKAAPCTSRSSSSSGTSEGSSDQETAATRELAALSKEVRSLADKLGAAQEGQVECSTGAAPEQQQQPVTVHPVEAPLTWTPASTLHELCQASSVSGSSDRDSERLANRELAALAKEVRSLADKMGTAPEQGRVQLVALQSRLEGYAAERPEVPRARTPASSDRGSDQDGGANRELAALSKEVRSLAGRLGSAPEPGQLQLAALESRLEGQVEGALARFAERYQGSPPERCSPSTDRPSFTPVSSVSAVPWGPPQPCRSMVSIGSESTPRLGSEPTPRMSAPGRLAAGALGPFGGGAGQTTPAGRPSSWKKDPYGRWLAPSTPTTGEKQAGTIRCPQPQASSLTMRVEAKTVQDEPIDIQFARPHPQRRSPEVVVGKSPRSQELQEEIQNLRNQLKFASKELRVHLLKRLSKMEASAAQEASFDETTISTTEDTGSIASLSSFSLSPEHLESRLQFTSP